MIDPVELLEFALNHTEVLAQLKRVLGLTPNEDPINVPLEQLDWRKGKIQLYAADAPTVESEEDVDLVRLPLAVVGIDSNGHRFIAYKDDILVRNADGAYSLVKRGVTRA